MDGFEQLTSIEQLGDLIRKTRKSLGLTQKDLALAAGTGLRFLVDLEAGKPTCQLGKSLTVIRTLGIRLGASVPLPRSAVHGSASKQERR